MPSSRGRAGGIIQSQGFLEGSEAQGWQTGCSGRGGLHRQRPLHIPTVSSSGWMGLAPAGSGSLEAQSLPVGPLSSLKSSVHSQQAPKSPLVL